VKFARIFLAQIGGCRKENIGAGLAEGIQGRERCLPILVERILK